MQQSQNDGRGEHDVDHSKHVLMPSQLGMYRQNRPPVQPAAMAVFVLRPTLEELCAAVGALRRPGSAPPRGVAFVADPVAGVLGWELTAAISALGHGASMSLKGGRQTR